MSASVFLSGDDYLALPRDPHQWLIQDLIPTGGLVNIYGQPKAGKSFAALGMAHAISSDAEEWLGFPVRKHGPAAILEIDTPRGDWAVRLKGMQDHGYSMAQVFTSDALMSPFPFDIMQQHDWLKAQLAALNPVVVFLDTLRELHGGDENDSTVMRNVMTQIISACRPATIVLLSHARKDTAWSQSGGDNLMSQARGSSYVAGKMDVVIKMTGNGQHATGMAYQGRSAASGRLDVDQDKDTGLIVLDTDMTAYNNLIKATVLRMRPDGASVNAMALAVKEETDYRKIGTHTSRINAFIKELSKASSAN